MSNTAFPARYKIDNASILFLAQMRKDHTNTFRFSMILTEEICPKTLQSAVNNVYRRFPTIIAALSPGLFHYSQIPVKSAPMVQPDPGYLRPMSQKELRRCGYRIYYKDNCVSIEAFHALTDGHGAIVSFTTLIAEYLHLKHNIAVPVKQPILDLSQAPQPYETEDSFVKYAGNQSKRIPRRYAYQLPGGTLPRESIKVSKFNAPSETLLYTAHRYGVTINTLISTIMASSVMEIQKKYPSRKLLPVRIMVPVNLRRIFPSQSLRNFSYYVLPTLEPEDSEKPVGELLRNFSTQIKSQLHKENLASIITNNVRLQKAWYFRMIPLPIKCALMRLICRFFGERTSSITVTNLGNVSLPVDISKYITHMEATLTPRMLSPYGCTVLSYNGNLSIHISSFPEAHDLQDLFFRKLSDLTGGKEDI